MDTTVTSREATGLEIAIVGMAGRFPGARTLDEFWRNLRDGVESVSFFSDEELKTAGIDPALLEDANYVKANAVLSDIDLFDASFFGFNPREAEILDPQQRLFLECTWEALENAGYDSERFKGAIGVYAGVGMNTYLLNNLQSHHMLESADMFQTVIGNDKDFLATRVSYKLNLEGPSITLQTACSTSLVAVHLASQGLISGECDMALAGSVAVRVPHKSGYLYQEGGIASPDGHCRAFDAGAQGTTFGNGVGVVVLKRLADALEHGDLIHAVILGSAINNDGSLKVGYTAPRTDGQAKVIRAAQTLAEAPPDTISYVEAHGTGTPMGDPIEIAALTQAFQRQTQRKGFCAIGSVKSNIGHLDTAAGIAGLIKTILALKHRQIPPSLHFERPNPQIDFANSPFYVNARLSEWRANGQPRRAGVSSFGIGGTNAHVILEEAPDAAASAPSRPWQLLVLSAKTSTALETATANLATYLRQMSGTAYSQENTSDDTAPQSSVLSPQSSVLADVAYTLQAGRRAFKHRRMLVCQDLNDAVAALKTVDPERVLSDFHEAGNRPVVFMFPGQGAQYVNMARGLYETEPLFREVVDRCAELLRPQLGLDLREVLYPDLKIEDRRWKIEDTESSILYPLSSILDLDQTQYTQPALFVIEYALAKLWMAWGVQPKAMIGHSIGEYVAACLAGVFSLEDALALVAARGRLIQQLPQGAMLAVALPVEEVQPLLSEHVGLAVVNGARQCVLAGPVNEIAALHARLNAEGTVCHRLPTSHAFHSPQIEPIMATFGEQVRRITLAPPRLPYISNVSGTWIRASDAQDPAYWVRHLREPVQFAAGMTTLAEGGDRVWLELGPGRTLSTLVKQHAGQAAGRAVLSTLRRADDGRPDEQYLLETIGRLWLAGVGVDWEKVHGQPRRRVALPSYPFERERHWIAQAKQRHADAARQRSTDQRRPIADWFYLPSWKRSMPPLAAAPADLAAQKATWLVFSDTCELGAHIVKLLAQADQPAVSVTAGKQFARLDDSSYTIHPRSHGDYDALLDELREADRLPQKILHLWSVTANDRSPSGYERLEQAQALGFYSLLFLAQALGKQQLSDPIEIVVVSNNMQNVAGETALYPEKATILGPCKVIPQEYPNITCRSIDIVLGDAEAAREHLAERLLAECVAPSQDALIAYRDNNRWVPDFAAIRLDAQRERGTRLRQGGVYLITGGLGGMGLVLAEQLARSARAKLVLTGRSTFPDRAEWEQWLATHDDETSHKIRKVQELERLGAEVLVASADVADQEQMRAVVQRANERFGAVHGVIHAAGVAGGGMIQLKTPEMASNVFLAKVNGTLALQSVFQDTKLDFFVLCSSMSSIVGGFGLVDYCAANAFLDAFANQNSGNGTLTIALNWDRWQDVGMATRTSTSFRAWESRQLPHLSQGPHPLLEKYVSGLADREIYLTEFRTATHWILSEHMVAGNPAIPGTAYLEMARAAFEDQAQEQAVELSGVFFIEPMILKADESRETLTIIQKDGDAYEFRVVSRSASSDGGKPSWQEHVQGKMGSLRAEPSKQIDIAQIVARCDEVDADITRYESEAAERFVKRGPRWKNLKRLYVGPNERLAFLELSEEFIADLAVFKLHPALLDMATGFARPAEEERFLPLAYERVRMRGALTPNVWSYVKYNDGDPFSKETVTCNVVITDEAGTVIVDIAGFSSIKVGDTAVRHLKGDAGGEQSAPKTNQRAADELEALYKRITAPESASDSSGILPSEGADAFIRVLSSATLPQIAISTRDIHEVTEQAKDFTRSRILEGLEQAEAARPAHPRPDIKNPYVSPTDELEKSIAGIWQRMLGIEQIGVHDNFFELGGDSLIGIRIVSELKKELQVDIPAVSLFEAPTVGALAKYLRKTQTDQTPFQHSQDRAGKKREVIERQRRLMKERKR